MLTLCVWWGKENIRANEMFKRNEKLKKNEKKNLTEDRNPSRELKASQSLWLLQWFSLWKALCTAGLRILAEGFTSCESRQT